MTGRGVSVDHGGGVLAFSGLGVLICGVEPHPPTGGVRVFVGPRYRGRYFVLDDPGDADAARSGWAASFCGHLVMDRRSVPYLLTEYRAGRW